MTLMLSRSGWNVINRAHSMLVAMHSSLCCNRKVWSHIIPWHITRKPKHSTIQSNFQQSCAYDLITCAWDRNSLCFTFISTQQTSFCIFPPVQGPYDGKEWQRNFSWQWQGLEGLWCQTWHLCMAEASLVWVSWHYCHTLQPGVWHC